MNPTSKKRLTKDETGRKYGFRSGLEDVVAKQLADASVAYDYEKHTVQYTLPVKARRYTPDFLIRDNGIIVETKGRFVTADRQKMKAVKAEHPNLDIRFVFSNPNARISKTSQTTYAKWCETNGFPYAKGLIPIAWLKEGDPDTRRRLANAKAFGVMPVSQKFTCPINTTGCKRNCGSYGCGN